MYIYCWTYIWNNACGIIILTVDAMKRAPLIVNDETERFKMLWKIFDIHTLRLKRDCLTRLDA